MCSFFSLRGGISVIQSDESLDFNSLKAIFMICNEHAARYTVLNDLEKASILLDGAQGLLKATNLGQDNGLFGVT